MSSFTPLEATADLNSVVTVNSAVSRRQGGAASRPVGIVIDKSCRVYITQIPVERIERDGANALRAEFEAFGPVESYKMFTEKSGRFIGSALCTFRNPTDAAAAISHMDGQTIDDVVVKAEVARDHGVMLLHQERRHDGGGGVNLGGGGGGGAMGGGRRGFLPSRLSEDAAITSGVDGGKWHHDRYQLIAEGKDMDEVLGIRRNHWRGGRGGRGGRGFASRGERIDAAFDKYIADRDALLEKKDEQQPQPEGEEQKPAEVTPPWTEQPQQEEVQPEHAEVAITRGAPAAPTPLL